MSVAIDHETKNWIRNRSDELATENGCRFDGERGQFVIDWAKKYLRLYEGEYAGQPLIPQDAQIEVTMRLFGWVKWSDRWQREIRRFRQASIWKPKKNKKSPDLAWYGLYLLCGDGEQGQKVYLGAKDGQQSREIAGKHAIEMCQASDELMSECSVNKSLMQITHEPSRSILKPISSSDARSQKSKEGLNGCVLIDETHVVDEDFMRRVSRAGISRSEPMQIELSTAGGDPHSYGRKRYEYGKNVEAGTFVDEQLFFVSYEAPQDVTDEQIAEDPVKYGRMANPAWGHTVGEEEYLADFNRSKHSIVDFADFKMYRLNIWQASANPWLSSSDWILCKREYTPEDLQGSACIAGLDLSKTKDMSSLVLVFPDEVSECYRQLAWFWLPQEEAERKNHLAPYLTWAHDGWLELTPDPVIDYRYILRKVLELCEKYMIQEIVYDPTFANELTSEVEEQAGITRVEFPQTGMRFAPATAEYESLVISGKLHHNGNPILTWQAGHVMVKTDFKGYKRPVKPKADDYRKIDGIVAGVMALDRAIVIEGGSVYEESGSMSL